MADDQVGATIGRRAVLKRHNVAIGSTNAYIQHAHLGLSVRCEFRLGMINNADFALCGVHGDGEHKTRIRETEGRRQKTEDRIQKSEARISVWISPFPQVQWRPTPVQ